MQHRHHCIISPLRLPADEWYHGVFQVLGILEEIDRDGVDVPLPSSRRQAITPPTPASIASRPSFRRMGCR